MKKIILPMTALAFILSSTGFSAETLNSLSKKLNQLTQETNRLKKEIAVLKKEDASQSKTPIKQAAHPVAVEASSHFQSRFSSQPWPHYVTVTTTPFMGKQLAYDGSDLLYNVTTINEDMHLLNQKKLIEQKMAEQGYTLSRPILQVSGEVEGMISSVGNYGGAPSKSITLSTAEIMFNAIASSWASAFMSMDFSGAPISTGNREPNSQIYLGRGFITIGDFNRTPFYFSMGLMYPPFGRYANSMVSTPMTLSMGKIRTATMLLGMRLNNGFYGSVYGFTGNQTSGESDLIKQKGINVGYKHVFSPTDNISLGAGWVSNIADSQGMQNTGMSTSTGNFGGFAVSNAFTGSSNNNLLAHAVDGLDGYATWGIGPFTFLGEFVTASRHFASTDLTYNGRDAIPSAAHGEVDYMLPFIDKKYATSIGASWDETWQSVGLNLPKEKYAVFLNTSIWRETTESIEYNHQIDYPTSANAFGRGASGSAASPTITGTGQTSDSVLAEIGVYF